MRRKSRLPSGRNSVACVKAKDVTSVRTEDVRREFRPSFSQCLAMSMACLNVRSLTRKVDDVIELRRDHNIDVFCLTETWQDSDSVAFNRLGVDGFHVVDRARPRADDMSVNHGGVAIITSRMPSPSP